MKKFEFNKPFFMALLKLALPILITEVIKSGANFADNVMVGNLSEASLSGVTMANQFFMIYTLMLFGMLSGGILMISQYFGKKDRMAVDRVVSISIIVTMCVVAVFTAVVLLLPEQIMAIYTPDRAVIAEGVAYLRIVGWSYLLYGITTVYVSMLRSVRVVIVPMVVNSGAFLLNILLNWIFIFGNWGAPAMGVAGAALGTLISRFVETVAIVLYARFGDKVLGFRFKNTFRVNRVLLRDFFKYTLPVVLNEVMFAIAINMFSVIMGRMGQSAMAAIGIAATIHGVLMIANMAMGSATCILVGNEIGAAQIDRAKRLANSLLLLNFCIGCLAAVGVMLLRGPILQLYPSITAETYGVTNAFLVIVACYLPFDYVHYICVTGIFRGGGDTKFAMFAAFLPLWLWSVPLGALAGLVFQWSAVATYAILKSDIFVRAVVCLIRLVRKKWIHVVVRQEEELWQEEISAG